MRRSRKIATLCFAAALLAPAAANAACLQSSMQGKWQVYAVLADSNQAGAAWTQCRININAAGTMGNTICTGSEGSGALTNGKITLSNGASCTFTATFKIDGALYKVLHATEHRNHDEMQGVGTFPGGGVFMFSMTKV